MAQDSTRAPDLESRLEYAMARIDALQAAMRLIAEDDLYGTEDEGYRAAVDVQARRRSIRLVVSP